MDADERGGEIQDEITERLITLAILWSPSEVLEFVEGIADQMRREIAELA